MLQAAACKSLKSFCFHKQYLPEHYSYEVADENVEEKDKRKVIYWKIIEAYDTFCSYEQYLNNVSKMNF